MQAPEKLTIDTPEQIALEFPLAGAGSRFLALAIDSLIQIGGLLGLGLLGLGALWLRSAGFQASSTWIVAGLLFAGFAIYYGYFAVFEAMWGGQTPGKRTVGLRVIKVSGEPITTYEALLRNLLRIVDQMPAIYAVGVLSVFFTSRNQRLGDLVAGTVVVQEHVRGHAARRAPGCGRAAPWRRAADGRGARADRDIHQPQGGAARSRPDAHGRTAGRAHPRSARNLVRHSCRRRSAHRHYRRRVPPAMRFTCCSVQLPLTYLLSVSGPGAGYTVHLKPDTTAFLKKLP